ncbi:hypothetical protein [Piscinibacter terrae]|uniref:Uncharacterized protein n=1 Tax=Piscinibacter terrae TaxID=2496871 RepID=A0A3N7HLQ5_9BURK|nr:hypothetical protein [Albitalea terrae]RQP23040.1 hypothetical protein DZC73_18100 [Albitalea terrae]
MPASVFPSSAVRRPAPPPAAGNKPAASRETVEAARHAVRGLLQRSQAFNALPEDKRRQLAHDLVQIGSYLAEPDGQRLKRQSPQVRALAGDPKPQQFGQATKAGVENMVNLIQGVNFPGFVSGLIQGVFHSIVDSSIQQMEAYAKLVADVSKSLNQFRDDNTTDNQGRDHLVDQFPDLFQLSTGGDDAFGDFGGDGNAPPQPRVTLREDVDEGSAIDRLNRSLPLDKPLTSLDDDVVEAVLVPAARTTIATGRQQLLATMVMMGINRIVVTDGKISAKVVFDFRASDNRKYAFSATRFDHEKDASGNLQMTNTYSGDYEGKSEGGSYSKSDDSEERRDGSYYAKGSYKYSQQPVVKLMSTQKLMDDSQLQTKASLTGSVEVNFKSDYLPLEKMANPENIAAIQMNAQPGMVKNLAARPQAAAGAPAPAPAAAATPAPAPAAAR